MNLTALLTISCCFHAAPIPKSDPEGTILLVRTSPQPAEMLLMKSGGTILKRFEPNGIEGHISGVKLNPSASKAIVLCQKPIRAVAGGGARIWAHYNVYRIDLEKTDEPAKLLIEDLVYTSRVDWLPQDKGIIFSDLDEKEANAIQPEDNLPYQSWTFNFETGKKEPLKLPKGQYIANLSPDGKMVLSTTLVNIRKMDDYSKIRTYLTPLDTLKPELVMDSEFKGSQFSPDGKWVLGSRMTKSETSSGYRTSILMFNLKTKDLRTLRLPEQAMSVVGTPAWANKGKSVAFVWYEQVADPELNGQISTRYNLGISNISSDSQKLILQNKPREYFTVFDWR